MELVTRHQIFYSNKSDVPVSEIAGALLALETIIKQCPSVLERLFPGVSIQQVEVYIDRIETGSLWEDFIVKFIFGGQARLDDAVSGLRQKLGMDKLANNKQLLSAVILAMILAGGIYYVKKGNRGRPLDF